MNSLIRFQGLSLTPDEHAAPNGSLALCAGVELHDGALRPSVVSGTPVTNALTTAGGDVVTLLYVHETTAYRHFIGWHVASSVGTLYWFNADGSLGGSLHTFSSGITIRDVDSIGNTLVIVADDAIHYAIFKEGAYSYIGIKPPYINLQFSAGIQRAGKYDRSSIETESTETEFYTSWRQLSFNATDVSTVKNDGSLVAFKSEHQGDITTGMWALINEANNTVAKEGRFYAPFYIRYCYRLYDGSMIMHSAPIYMPITGKRNYKIYFEDAAVKNGSIMVVDNLSVHEGNETFHVNKFCMRYEPANVPLQYRLAWADRSLLEELRTNWADVVKSIDIFITPPIVREDQSQMVNSAIVESDDDWRFISNNLRKSVSNRHIEENIFSFSSWNWQTYEYSTNVIMDIPMLSMDAFRDKLSNQASFYRVYSIDLETASIPTSFTDMPLDKTAVEHIATQEKMVDDYKTHNVLMPIPQGTAGSYAYNHRINLFGLREQLYSGFEIHNMLPWVDVSIDSTSETVYANSVQVDTVYVEISTEEGKKVVSSPVYVNVSIWLLRNMPLFYPDSRANRMIIKTSSYYIILPLKSCPELNGAIYVGNFSTTYDNTTTDAYTYTVGNNKVNLQNKIYTSQVNNPFYFPVEGINTVGIGSIMGIAAATRALSQGQFGQFPLMAFSTDGIWALAVSSTGTYSAIHNISREVVSNPESITQLDQSVVFATARSISKVVESSVASLSEVLDGPWFNCGAKLPNLSSYFAYATGDTEVEHNYKSVMQQLMAFSSDPVSYFQTCRVLYDYVCSRLIIMPKNVSADSEIPVFVYSIRSGSWSTMLLPTPLTVINSNPYPYIQKKDGSVRRLDLSYDYNDAVRYPGIIVTRTLKLSEVVAALSGFSQTHNSHQKCVIFFYGSHDNINWRYIGKSSSIHSDYLPAHSFRYFRLAVFSRMTTSERYMSVTLSMKDKYRKF
jgi:hypothetical protein